MSSGLSSPAARSISHSRVLQRTSAIFRYAIQTGRAIYNPAADMKGVLKTRKVEHRSTINRGELPDFLKKLDAYSGDLITKLALRLIVLTFVRTGELRGARCDEAFSYRQPIGLYPF